MKFKVFKNQKFKALFFLFCAFVYCVGLVFVFGYESNNEGFEKYDQSRESNVELGEFEYGTTDVSEVEEASVDINTDNVENEEEGEVLGWFSGRGTCEDTDLGLENPQFFCSELDLSTEYKTTEYVKPDAEVELVEIYAPSALFTGAGNPFDNLVQTTNPEGKVAFRNASEIIDPEFDYSARQPPLSNVESDGFDRETGESDSDHEHFVMHAQSSGSFDSEGVGRVPMDTAEDDMSVCPHVVNDGRFNVEKSNELGKRGVESVTPPGLLDGLNERRENTEFCQNPPERVIRLSKDESFPLCKPSMFERILGTLTSALPGVSLDVRIFRFEESEDYAEKKVAFKGVLIDAPLGSASACETDACGIRYTEAGRLLGSPPTMTEDMSLPGSEDDYVVNDPIYLTTPCEVRVDDDELIETECYWDLSAWQHLFALEETFTYPGHENKYSEEEYWWLVEMELRGMNVQEALEWRNDPHNIHNPEYSPYPGSNSRANPAPESEVVTVDKVTDEYIDELIEEAREEDDEFEEKVDVLKDYASQHPGSHMPDDDRFHEYIASLSNLFQQDGKQLDYRLLYAIATAESRFGVTSNVEGHNAWGMMDPASNFERTSNFEDWETGAYVTARNLFNNYYMGWRNVTESGNIDHMLGNDGIIANIGQYYCPVGAANDPDNLNRHWRGNVEDAMKEMGVIE